MTDCFCSKIIFVLIEKSDRHLLLHVSSFENFGKLLKRNQIILVQVSFHNSPLGNGYKLFSADIGSYHHCQHCQQLLLADLVVSIQVVHSECEVKFFHSRVQLVLFDTFLYWPEVSQDTNKVLEVHLVIISIFAFVEESVDNPIAQWVDGELRDTQEVFPAQVPLVLLVQAGEPAVKSFNLVLVKPRLSLYGRDVLRLQLEG